MDQVHVSIDIAKMFCKMKKAVEMSTKCVIIIIQRGHPLKEDTSGSEFTSYEALYLCVGQVELFLWLLELI